MGRGEVMFGQMVRLRREALKISQRDLASRISCSVSYVEKIERGDREPSLQVIGSLVQALQTSADKLLFGSVEADDHAGVRWVKRLQPTRAEIEMLDTVLLKMRESVYEDQEGNMRVRQDAKVEEEDVR